MSLNALAQVAAHAFPGLGVFHCSLVMQPYCYLGAYSTSVVGTSHCMTCQFADHRLVRLPLGQAFFVLQAQVALLLDGMAVFDRTIKVSMARGGAGPGVVRSNDPDRVQRTVHVGGLPMEELSETVLADFFQNVGEVGEVAVDML